MTENLEAQYVSFHSPRATSPRLELCRGEGWGENQEGDPSVHRVRSSSSLSAESPGLQKAKEPAFAQLINGVPANPPGHRTEGQQGVLLFSENLQPNLKA